MCYAKPGPRCSSYALKMLSNAHKAWGKAHTEVERSIAMKNIKEAEEQYDTTPAGQHLLEDLSLTTGDPDGLFSARLERGIAKRKQMLESIGVTKVNKVNKVNKVKVFRSGVVAVPVERGCEAEVYAAVDARRPKNHPTRTYGIFASPEIDGVIRWVRGNDLSNFLDVAVREITVDADTVMVYRVNDWERVSSVYDWNREEIFTERTAKYFSDSMPLAQWLAGDYDPEQWEVIFSAEAVLGVRNVSLTRLISATKDDYTAREIKSIYRRHNR